MCCRVMTRGIISNHNRHVEIRQMQQTVEMAFRGRRYYIVAKNHLVVISLSKLCDWVSEALDLCLQQEIYCLKLILLYNNIIKKEMGGPVQQGFYLESSEP